MNGQPQIQFPSAWEMIKQTIPGAWALSKLLWPIWLMIGIMLLIVITKWKIEKFVDQKRLEKIKKKCPDCAEWVPKEAIKCSHCSKIF